MSTHLSGSEIFRKVEERMKLQEERAAFHSRQEVHPREQSAFHAAELQKVREHFEAFKATALARTGWEIRNELRARVVLAGPCLRRPRRMKQPPLPISS